MLDKQGFILLPITKILLSIVLVGGLFFAPYSVAFAQPQEEDSGVSSENEVLGYTEDEKTDGTSSVAESEDQSQGQDSEPSDEVVIQDGSEENNIYSDITDEEVADALEGISSQSTRSSFAASNAENEAIKVFAGETRYETSAQQALAGWESSQTAILVSGDGWADALGASGLAGALDCPILLTKSDSLPDVVRDALVELGVSKVIILGGQTAVSSSVEVSIKDAGISDIERLGGSTRYDTQLNIYQYGKEGGLWNADTVIVANGASDNFADALSVSPIAFTKKAPIFIVDTSGMLSDDQEAVLIEGAAEGSFSHVVMVGGTARISDYTAGFLEGIAIYGASDQDHSCIRIAGETRYETSAQLASWAMGEGLLSADGAGFASANVPYDALGGGALQGHNGSVLLLISDGSYGAAVDALNSVGGVETISFFGGNSAISDSTKKSVSSMLNIVSEDKISYTDYSITLEQAISLEQANSNYSKSELNESMNPSNWDYGDAGFYQFADLSKGYSGAITASQLNQIIDSKVVYQESERNCTSMLRGTGEYFIQAAKKYNINEVYLLSHAAIESAWGCSTLAQGKVEGYEGFYNFYGIGAFDIDPNNQGAALAKENGWTSSELAIMGAAKWISDRYIHSTVASGIVSGDQNTLYKMKWDLKRAESEGAVWHQYATSRTWATGIASVMNSCYSYLGMGMDDTGLSFDVPRFK